MGEIAIHSTGIHLRPNNQRVLIRPFIPADSTRIVNVIGRALALSESEAEEQLAAVRADFHGRHADIEKLWRVHFEKVSSHMFTSRPISETRKLLIGALFTGEYSMESAALSNPSIVAHPDQTGLGDGEVRFVMSLRAIGEGHISSIEFRSGIIHADYSVALDGITPFVAAPEINPDPSYHRTTFTHKLAEMGLESELSTSIMEPLGDTFTRSGIEKSIRNATRGMNPSSREVQRTMECVRWLADSASSMSERVIFPFSPNESNGIEDARFVRFADEEGSVTYYATYTAYNGRVILPQLIETTDFLNFHVRTLNGRAVQNKGMALFPRRIDGHYAMISRQDDENIFLMYSDHQHFWSDPRVIERPNAGWEMFKIGNCGSPIETEAGWLLLTHGVGPMRKYCIGAILLDLQDPSKIIGRLDQPLLKPGDETREGYVPNVVYTCGALVHRDRLILPYGLSDSSSAIVTVELGELLGAMAR